MTDTAWWFMWCSGWKNVRPNPCVMALVNLPELSAETQAKKFIAADADFYFAGWNVRHGG